MELHGLLTMCGGKQGLYTGGVVVERGFTLWLGRRSLETFYGTLLENLILLFVFDFIITC